ncbi:DUF488 domain-containing protein [Luteibacter aegosomatissinici]|uniref:DUF488 domain-containing protein n=1 Tax=Luteibacter aegosomatissinici TaxID=2911539 RepID=UPI001FF7BD54|nr:DUF488 family protein [Luteibacter aegosomatissinici]UPG96632.1 DUF488 family protein [Luteibacter aegosomatissinici]
MPAVEKTFAIKPVRDAPATADGRRVLVDRLWPRGVSRERAALDDWWKEIAPTPELRTWFDHREDRFAEFTERYLAELRANPFAKAVRAASHAGRTTLLYGAKDHAINHAVVLARFLNRRR